MSRWFHAPCPNKDCGSSDGFSWKTDDKFGHCFVCGKSNLINPDEAYTVGKSKAVERSMLDLAEIATYDTRGFIERGITKTVAAHYGCKVSYNSEGEISAHFYPYTKDGEVVAYKERKIPKSFTVHGDFKGVELFGQAQAGGGKRVIITEGELDAMSIAQANYEKYEKFYAVVSLPSASQTSVLLEQREFLRGFEEVILCLDNDKAGKEALQKAAKIIGYDKVKIAALPEKDASDVLIKHGGAKLLQCLWDAKPFSPSGMVKGEEVWDQYKARKSVVAVPYPPCLQGLNDKLDGMREGEMVLLTSGTGAGKSTITKEILLHITATTKDMAGLVSLEESVGDTAQKLIGMQLKKDISKFDVTEKEERKAFEAIFGDERLVLLDHQGSVSDDSLLDKIEHLALLGCKYIILDHITIAVSEGADGKSGNEAVDFVMSSLLKIVKKHNIWLGIVSHLRKGDSQKKPFEEGRLPTMDDIKGSGSIKQISFDIIGFTRNSVAEDENERNTILFRVLKARFTGRTGNAGRCTYDPKTSRLTWAGVLDFE